MEQNVSASGILPLQVLVVEESGGTSGPGGSKGRLKSWRSRIIGKNIIWRLPEEYVW